METSEQGFITELREGSEEAWRRLFEEHYAPLCYIAEQYVHDRFLAEAIVGDTIFHLWEVRSEVRVSTGLRQYLARSVHNRCLDYLKREHVRREVPAGDAADDDFPILAMVRSDDYPLSHLLAKELEGQIQAAIDALPDECRRVFRMSRMDDLPVAEIARQLGISPNTVKYHIKHALRILRANFSQYMAAALVAAIRASQFCS